MFIEEATKKRIPVKVFKHVKGVSLSLPAYRKQLTRLADLNKELVVNDLECESVSTHQLNIIRKLNDLGIFTVSTQDGNDENNTYQRSTVQFFVPHSPAWDHVENHLAADDSIVIVALDCYNNEVSRYTAEYLPIETTTNESTDNELTILKSLPSKDDAASSVKDYESVYNLALKHWYGSTWAADLFSKANFRFVTVSVKDFGPTKYTAESIVLEAAERKYSSV